MSYAESEENLKYGTMVEYDTGKFSGVGKIVGIAQCFMPYVGIGYILEDISGLDKEVYEYTHFVLYAAQIKKIIS